ncbi:MAG: Nif3-like dinuclear metal center hexameric protein [Cyclobacteriaceae bacterium]
MKADLMQIKDITNFLENWAPPSLQESYDNSGLIIGDSTETASGAVITLDVTEAVIDEAIATKSNLIIAHHPLIFSGVKRIGTTYWIDKCIRKAIKNDINIYAIHTNLDNVRTGVNARIADRIGLRDQRILKPKSSTLQKLTVFVPTVNREKLLTALFEAGAGEVGNYDHCSFQISGEGTFRPNDQANPVIGSRGVDEVAQETRIEVIIPTYKKASILSAMRQHHPYEEVAYYLSDLSNQNQGIGSGMIGNLDPGMTSGDFLGHLKSSMDLKVLKHTKLVNDKINRVALCGGSGRFLLETAIAAGADIFISADFKYHDFFEANDEIIITDIGHYESEVFTKELIYERLTKNFAKFAFRLSEVDTNPVKFL